MDDLTGKHVRGYEMREQIGSGGFGAVYRAYQSAVNRDVAIKVILPKYANDPQFIRRFEVEAQLIARLEHFHIAPLYDYWREPDGAYLVTRYLRGGSLRNRLDNNEILPVQEIIHLVDQLCAALATAHKHGIIHRDLKPDNFLLDEEGNAYLSDFGISVAIDTSKSAELSELVGTPAYLAPEQLMLEKVTPQSDIYSFGIVLFELLTGKRPYPDAETPAQWMQFTLNEPMPPVTDFRSDLSHAVDKVIQQATAKDPKRRYANAVSLAEDFKAAMTPHLPATETFHPDQDDIAETTQVMPKMPPIDSERTITPADMQAYAAQEDIVNPYKGLRAFREADADDFYGRSNLVNQLLQRLHDTDAASRRFLAVVGPSGSGKSSVVKAGLIPALRNGALPNSENWFMVEMFPGTHPFEELEAALLRVAINPPDSLLTQLKSDERGLVRAVKRILPGDENTELVLMIDQFEELFTQVESEEIRQQFVDNLLSAAQDPRSQLRIIVTIRADFYDRPLLYEGFGRLMEQHTQLVLPLSSEELENAIVQPAENVNVKLESGLISAILHDVGEQPGALPLLQYALTELFERRHGREMTLGAYQDMGGVLGALARRADELYLELDDTAQSVARQLFLRLVTIGDGAEDTRRRVRRSEITITDTESTIVNNVIDSFGKHRLLTFDRDPITREPTVEVAHEALLRTWKRLNEWINTSRDDLRLHRRLTTAAREWEDSGQESSYLALGIRLAEFDNFASTTDLALSVAENAYLDASRDHRDMLQREKEQQAAHEVKLQRRAVNRARILAMILGLFLAVTWFFLTLSIQLQRQARNINRELDHEISTSEQREADAISARETAVVGENSRATAQREAEDASTRVIEANVDLAVAETQAADIERTLTPLAQTIDYSSTQIAEAAETLVAVGEQVEAQQNLAESLRLANEVNRIFDEPRPDELSVLLAIRALSTAYTAPADRYLIEALEHQRTLYEFRTDGDPFEDFFIDFAINHDGSLAVTTGSDNTAILWDMNTRQAIHIFEHDDYVRRAEFSPDEETILTSSFDATAILWDIETGEKIHTFAHDDLVRDIAFSPDGQFILTASRDDTAALWDVATGERLHLFQHSDDVRQVAFSPNGQLALTGSNDNTAILWDIETGEQFQILIGHQDNIEAIAFSPDGSFIVTGSKDTTVRLWDTEMGKLIRVLGEHTNEITSIAFSPDGSKVLTGSLDATARLWDVESGETIHVLEGHVYGVASVTFSPDGNIMLTGGYDDTTGLDTFSTAISRVENQTVLARTWDVETGQLINLLPGQDGTIIKVGFADDGHTAFGLGIDASIRVWNLNNPSEPFILRGHGQLVQEVIFSPDGSTLTTGSSDLSARLWDAQTGETLQTFIGYLVHLDHYYSMVYSADGQSVFVIFRNLVRRWDVNTADILEEYTGSTDILSGIALSPNGQWLAGVSDDGSAYIWAVETGEIVHTLLGHSAQVNAVHFSPDGSTLLTVSEDTTVRLWDVETGELLHLMEGHSGNIWTAAFAPDGQTVVTGSWDNTAILWDVETGELIHTLAGHTDFILSVAFAPDGKTVLTGGYDHTARIWDVETGEVLQIFSGHGDVLDRAIYAPDGQIVITASRDGTARLWDVETGEVLRILQGHRNTVRDVAISSDGRFIATASDDSTIRLWHTDYHDFIDYACSRMFRDFTPAERAEFGIDDTPTCPQFGLE